MSCLAAVERLALCLHTVHYWVSFAYADEDFDTLCSGQRSLFGHA